MEEQILYSDKNIIVINKLPGQDSEKLWSGFGFFPESNGEVIYPVNRLDMPVSGCIMGGFSKPALKFYGKLFRENKIKKEYWAIAFKGNSIPERGRGFCEDYIYYDRCKRKAFIAKDLKDGCKALCEWEILGISDNYVFFKLFPQTGKTHQLRIQLSNMGFPVKGDLKYGSKRSDSLPGIRLHCHSIKFPLMNCNREITVESLPRYSDNLWNYFYDLYYGKRK